MLFPPSATYFLNDPKVGKKYHLTSRYASYRALPYSAWGLAKAQRKSTKVDVAAFWPTSEGGVLNGGGFRTVRCVQRVLLLQG
ncbi:MAG: hypothetical protein O7G87_07330 [bacterium]|nr:hypothetical protein [bacterium]